MDNYYLKINVITKNNNKYFNTCELRKSNRLIKIYDNDITKEIYKLAKDNNIDIINKNNTYIIDDINFISNYIGIPSSKISHINKYAGMIATSSILALGSLGISTLDHIYNPELYSNTKENSIDNAYNDEETTEEISFDDSNANLIFNTTEEENNTHIKYYSDDDNNYVDSTNETIVLTNYEDEYLNSFNDNNTYSFYYSDLENQLFIDNIISKYDSIIRKYSDYYGIDYNLIVAFIAQENPRDEISTWAAGQFQVERSVWDGQTVIDKDGNNLYIDCNLMDIDPDYAIHVGCYIYWFSYNMLNDDNNRNNFNYHLTDAEVFALSISAYNKSVYNIESILERTNNIEEAYNEIELLAGDTEYREKVLSGLQDNTIINMTTNDDEVKQILIHNYSLENSIAK